jgi:predicted nucleic acid-binding protein
VSYLLDTNVISEARKLHGSPQVKAWLSSVSSDDLYLSSLTLGEIRQGVERLRRRDPTQAAIFERWLATLRRDFATHVLPVDPEVAEEWGRLNVPDPLPAIDSLLAATARVHGLTLVTRNVADVARTGVRVLNPFVPVP